MIARICVACPGCTDAVCFRIVVSGEAGQAFAVACPHCNAALRGVLQTVPDEGRIVGLNVDGQPAQPIEEDDDTPIVNVSTDLLIDPTPDSMADPGGSPFLMHVSRLGDDLFLQWRTTVADFDRLVDNDWMNVARWWGYYTEERWDLFDSHARQYWNDEWPENPSDIGRHDAMHRALEVLLLHVYGAEYVQMNALARRNFPGAEPDEVNSLAETLANNGRLASAQTELFDVLDEFIQKRFEWRAGTLALTYDSAGVQRDSSWQIQRDDFSSLRALYLACFERSYRYVDLAMMLRNAIDRGDALLYPDGERRSMRHVERLRAVDKEEILSLYDWGRIFVGLFDRGLRNAIGHADARHVVGSGVIAAPSGQWSYAQFVVDTVRAVQCPLFLLNIVKLLNIVASASLLDVE